MSDSGGRIVVSELSKAFGSVGAVDELSFTVEPGSVTGFLGPNGAGKTTTLRMLLGLIVPDAGSATIGGRTYAALADPTRVVGAALEATGFHPARSGRDHLRVYCTVTGLAKTRADELLARVGLTEAGKRKVGGYSLGMRQRLALASALLGDPDVLVLDEPANGLDPEGIAWMRRLLREFADLGKTVLVSSHVLSEVQQLADQLVILDHGQLVYQGAVSEPSLGDGVRVRAPNADALVDAVTAAQRTGSRIERNGPENLTIHGMTGADVGRIARGAHIELHELTPLSGDLEHLFLTLTGAARTEEVRRPCID